MKTCKTLSMIGAAALVASLGAAPGSARTIDAVNTTQVNFMTAFSNLSLYGNWLGGLRATSAAIGNNGSVQIEGDMNLWNTQLQLGDVGATLKAFVNGVHGDVNLQAVGICNNFSAENTGAGGAGMINYQRCNTFDPFAVSTVSLDNVGGDATISSMAIANNFTGSSDADELYLTNLQINAAVTYASVAADVGNVAGDVTMSAVAIGNNFTFQQPE